MSVSSSNSDGSIEDLEGIATLQDINEIAQRIAEKTRGQSNRSNNVLENARTVARHENYISGTLASVIRNLLAIIGELGQNVPNYEQLRDVLEQIDDNTVDPAILQQINQVLIQTPNNADIQQQLGEMRTAITQSLIQSGIERNPEQASQRAAQILPPTPEGVLTQFRGLDDQPGAPVGGRKRKHAKRGGYGWSGKKGVEVRSSIKTTRRTKGKKGKKSSSNNKTKRRSSKKK